MKQTDHTITQAQYAAFQTAYDFLNDQLFGGELPPVLITLQRKSKAYGYLSPARFVGRNGGNAEAHELALNPDHFGRTDVDILSTLAHEMVHVWQQTFGKPPRKNYHDKQWGAKMLAIGLHPSSTGAPGGKETGARVSHYIIEGGAYHRVYMDLAARGFALLWQSRTDDGERQKKAASKTKYTCPVCDANAWAKPESILICGACYYDMGEAIHVMEAEI